MRVDSHQHFWHYNAARDFWITDEMPVLKRDYLPADLLPELSALGIKATVAVQADQSEQETRFLIELAARNVFIAGVIGWIDLRAPNPGERLEYFSRFEVLRGFRHLVQSEPDDGFLLRDDVMLGIRALRQFDYTYDLLISAKQLPAAVELVEQLPDQRFVLDHIAKPPVRAKQIDAWAQSIRELAAHPRVFCKISGLITEADWRCWCPGDFKPYLDVVFEAFGPDRLMFGSDWPVCLLAGTYLQVKELIDDYIRDWPDSDKEKVLGGNAIRFYGLKSIGQWI
jgi:L-fuconolactonase